MNEAMKARLDSLIAHRDNLVEQMESAQAAIDERLAPFLRLYFDFRHDIGLRNQCAPSDYRFEAESREGYYMSHDCFDHGYDLHSPETVEIPREFITDREAYMRRVRAEVEAANTRAAAKRRTALLAELEALEAQA